MSHFRRIVSEIHRRSLWQVLGIYAVASWVIYQVVLALYDGIGLPSWVPGTALVLLLIGLPIVLATAFVQEGPLGLRGDERPTTLEGLETAADPLVHARVEPGASSSEEMSAAFTALQTTPMSETGAGAGAGLLTWSRAITGGVLAFAALGLAATGFMGMRALGIGPAGTLLAKGVLTANEPLLLADFQSATGDSLLALTLTDAFRVGLEQSTAVTLLPRERVAGALERMRRERGAPLRPDLARELGQREGLKAYVEGDVNSVGSDFVLTIRLVSTTEGAPLVSLSRVAPDSSALIPAVGALATELRERIGESLRTIRATPPLERVTTASLPALLKYAQAWRVWNETGDSERAIRLMEEAIAEDSAFAMAWRALGPFYFSIGDLGRVAATVTRAFELSDRLPDRERYHVHGLYYSEVVGDHPRSIDAYELLLQTYPEDPRALNNVAREYALMLAWDRSAAHFRRALDVNRNSAVIRRNLLANHELLGRWAAYDSAAAEYRERFPDQAPVQFHAALAASARGDYAAAVAAIDSVARTHPGRFWQQRAAWEAGHLAGVRGRLREARRHFARHLELARQDGDRADQLAGEIALATYEAALLGDGDAALRRVQRHLASHPLSDMDPFDRGYADLSAFYAAVGEADLARAMMAAHADSAGAANRVPALNLFVGRTEGFLRIAEGAGVEGLALARRWSDQLRCGGCVGTDLGRAFDLAGMPDSALHYYEMGVRHGLPLTTSEAPLHTMARAQLVALPYLGATYARAAELHETRGDTAAAARRYQDLIGLWQDADPELQPRVEAARRALARLTAEGGG